MRSFIFLCVFPDSFFHFLLNCSIQSLNLRIWLVFVLWENINLFPVFPTSPVSMATLQGTKDRLLARKFLTALMKVLQEVHDPSGGK